MSNPLVEKINAEIEAKIKEIEAETESKLAKIKAEGESRMADLALSSQDRVKKQKDQLERVTTSKVRQDGHIAVQTTKRDALDSFFAEAFTSLVEEGKDEYVNRFTALGKETLPKELKVVSVECPAQREEETEDILKELGLDSKVESNPTIKAGLIIVAEDGVFDLTLDRLFKERRPMLEMNVMEKINSL